MTAEFIPAYLKLGRAAVQERAEQAVAQMACCRLCPRRCEENRLEGRKGTCGTDRRARVSSFFPHLGEEDCLRGSRGSGTIFFALCNLRCHFCQNWDISWEGEGTAPCTAEDLAAMMLWLQEQGCHNVNLVTPSHVVPQILEALPAAIEQGLRLPLVYNTGSYDSAASLAFLDGVVDIYMPDFKVWDPAVAKRLMGAEDYPEIARAAIREMHRQVGPLVLDERGLALRGVLLRHLVMPGGIAGTREVMAWLAREVSADTYVNLMAQYHPAGRVVRTPQLYADLDRRVSRGEMAEAMRAAREAGLHRFDARR